MLTVAKVTARVAAGYADYLEGKTSQADLGDYYLRDGERAEAPGRWVTGAHSVGLDPGVVEGRVLRELMAVRHPVSGEPLRQAGAGGTAVAALDATFSAPKSVSAVWAVAGEGLRREIEGVHEAAIDRAVRYATGQVAMIRRRGEDQKVGHGTAAGVIATSWRHTTARAVENQPPDPQLHSHVLLHAAVRRDGRVVAIDSRAWLNHRREVGAAYRTELAHGLTQLGFNIKRQTGRGGRYFELAHVPQALLDRWSSRHRQVQAEIQAKLIAHPPRRMRSGLTPAQERRAALHSRQRKQPVTTAELDRDWQTTAREAGLDRRALGRLQVNRLVALEPASAAGLLSALTEFDATFSDREARAVALERSAGVPIERALQCLSSARAGGEVLRLVDGRATTRQHRRTEHAVLSTTRRISDDPTSRVPLGQVRVAVGQLDRRLAAGGARLSGEQREAIAIACGEQRVVMIEGQAGTGKSTVLQAVALAHQADGRRVFVTSTAAVAAERLAKDLREVGVEVPAYSTAALTHAISTGALELGSDATVIHDEAALASTREQYQLLTAVESSGARLVLVGDPGQSKPVGAGGLWPRLEHTLHEPGAHCELTQNVRAQHAEDRRDQRLFREGEHKRAIRGYAQRERIHITQQQTDAEDHALQAAHEDRRTGRHTLVLAQTTNEHLDELNAHAQALRVLDGELGAERLPLAGRPYELRPGDEIQIRRTIPVPGHGRLRNGTPATVAAIDSAAEQAHLRLHDGSEVLLDRDGLDRAEARLAYVQHPFPAQGMTSDTAHLIVSDHTTREGTYVALTRARHETHIHASHEQITNETDEPPLTQLADILARTEPDLPSISTPLAHEHELEQEPERQADENQLSELGTKERPAHQPGTELTARALPSAVDNEAARVPEDPSALPRGPFQGTSRPTERSPEERPRPRSARPLEPRAIEYEEDLGWEP